MEPKAPTLMECPPYRGLWHDCEFMKTSVPPIDMTPLYIGATVSLVVLVVVLAIGLTMLLVGMLD